MPELIVKLDGKILQTCRFDEELLRIGRSRENDVILENLSVSRQHGQIRLHDGRFMVTDMNSANGILVNGVRITKTEIVDQDVITIGKHKLVFQLGVGDSMTVLDEPVVMESPHKKRAAVADGRPAAWLTVESGKLKDREFRITRFETSLGKAMSNDVVITDDWLLGKKQAIILRKGNSEFEIQDLGGLRRVKVNGDIVNERSPLRNDDIVEIGGTKLLFHLTVPQQQPGAVPEPEPDLPTPAENESARVISTSASKLNIDQAMRQFADNESLDLEEGYDFALVGNGARTLKSSEADVSQNEQFVAVGADQRHIKEQASSNGTGQNVFESNQRRGNRGKRHQRTAQKATRDPGAAMPGDMVQPADHSTALAPDAALSNKDNAKEIKIWEEALKNGSPAIRRQAARILKELTGRDYEA